MNFHVFAPKYPISAQFPDTILAGKLILEQAMPAFATAWLRHCNFLTLTYLLISFKVREFCEWVTKQECKRIGVKLGSCKKLHFRKLLHSHTDVTLGDCSFLNTCFHMDTCKVSANQCAGHMTSHSQSEASVLVT